MKTMTEMSMSEKLERKKRLFYLTLVGYAVFVLFAVLRALTDWSEWRHKRSKVL